MRLFAQMPSRNQILILRLQLLARFNVIWVKWDARHWAHNLTLRLVIMPDAFCAQIGVDFINVRAHVNGLIRTFGFAHIAIDAFVGDDERHIIFYFKIQKSR